MANYTARARSNYFKVKNEAAFLAWAEKSKLEVWDDIRDGRKYFAICPDTENGDWPTDRFNEEDDSFEELDVLLELSEHLDEASVAVLLECGSEKLRYLSGWAMAINSKGEQEHILLFDIYEKAKHLGSEITEAIY